MNRVPSAFELLVGDRYLTESLALLFLSFMLGVVSIIAGGVAILIGGISLAIFALWLARVYKRIQYVRRIANVGILVDGEVISSESGKSSLLIKTREIIFGPIVQYRYLLRGKKYAGEFRLHLGRFNQRRNYYPPGTLVNLLVDPSEPAPAIILDEYYRW